MRKVAKAAQLRQFACGLHFRPRSKRLFQAFLSTVEIHSSMGGGSSTKMQGVSGLDIIRARKDLYCWGYRKYMKRTKYFVRGHSR